MTEKVSVNRQDIITVDGVHYKQEHRLVAWERNYDYQYPEFRSDRFYASPGV